VNNYVRSRDELVWLLDFAKRNEVRMTALFNGYYVQLAMRRKELDPLRRLINEGHEIGTHAHSICYDKTSDRWFRDTRSPVDALLDEIGAGDNGAMCAMFGRGMYS